MQAVLNLYPCSDCKVFWVWGVLCLFACTLYVSCLNLRLCTMLQLNMFVKPTIHVNDRHDFGRIRVLVPSLKCAAVCVWAGDGDFWCPLFCGFSVKVLHAFVCMCEFWCQLLGGFGFIRCQ